MRMYHSGHENREVNGMFSWKLCSQYCVFFICACFVAEFAACKAKHLTLGEFSSMEGRSAKVCLMRLGISELSSPRKASFPVLTQNETDWNAADQGRIDSMPLQSYAGGGSARFTLDGHRRTVRASGTLSDPDGPVKMVTRKNLKAAVEAFGFRLFSERISKSKEHLTKFIPKGHMEPRNDEYDEKIGFIMRLGFNTRFSKYSARGVRVLETCETNYVENAISYTGNRFSDQMRITEHRVNVFLEAVNLTSDTHREQPPTPWSTGAQGYLVRYSGIWKAGGFRFWGPNRKTLATYNAAKNLHFKASVGAGPVGLYLTSFNLNSQDSGSTFVFWDSIGSSENSNSSLEKLYTVKNDAGREENFTMRSGYTDDATITRVHNAWDAEWHIISDVALSSAREKARKALEKELFRLDENNDTLELVLACSALLTAIITVMCFGTSRLKILLRICLEVMDLVVGAVPGFVVLRRGLFRGNLRLGPAAFVTRNVPSKLVLDSNKTQTADGKAVNAMYFPVLVTECTAVGFRRSPNRMWFIVAYSLGISVGVLILIFQLWYYMRVRRRREASIYHAENPELSELSENGVRERRKPCIRPLLILRRRCRRLKKLRVLPRKTRASEGIPD